MPLSRRWVESIFIAKEREGRKGKAVVQTYCDAGIFQDCLAAACCLYPLRLLGSFAAKKVSSIQEFS
jgi:hypothetical protein